MKRTLQEIADMFGIYLVKNSFPDEQNQYKWFSKKPAINIDGGFWESIRDDGYPWFGSTFSTELIEPFEGDWRDSLHSPRVVCPDCEGTGKSTEHNRDYPPDYYACPTCHGAGWVEREGV